MHDHTVIGLEKGVVRLEPYTPEWKRIFEAEKAALHEKLGSMVSDIQHVGSTSIPGMPAKPIIDIAIGVADFYEARRCISLIEAQGYEYRGEFGIPKRHYFSKGDPRTFHIHMLEIGSQNWNDLLLFRDTLSTHSEMAAEYASLKRRLASRFPRDREAYLEGKAEFIKKLLDRERKITKDLKDTK
jgi:GrpB-like predicted nucleotidyltransferase (UPF0157 family)